ncbi:unnamed protein product [Protopolystoma xenopodis]|uniref:Uncharacterized protein n=1 Tax=Protopolystoma xenopodis TaxID=117903 RepID=A0A3S5CKH7_9PLAT|nr:unnamed protein product [Protopolystoma xenopodis]
MSAPDNKFSAILSSVREPLHASSLTASKSLQCQRQLVEKQQETSESKSACLPKPCLESQPAPPEMNSSAVKVPSGQIAWHDSDKKGSCMNSLPDTSNSEFFMPLADDKRFEAPLSTNYSVIIS